MIDLSLFQILVPRFGKYTWLKYEWIWYEFFLWKMLFYWIPAVCHLSFVIMSVNDKLSCYCSLEWTYTFLICQNTEIEFNLIWFRDLVSKLNDFYSRLLQSRMVVWYIYISSLHYSIQQKKIWLERIIRFHEKTKVNNSY